MLSRVLDGLKFRDEDSIIRVEHAPHAARACGARRFACRVGKLISVPRAAK
jgi:hypothetical protein